jgi:hypothetical protein
MDRLFPRSGLQLLGGKHNLTDVVRIMPELILSPLSTCGLLYCGCNNFRRFMGFELIEARKQSHPSFQRLRRSSFRKIH